MHTRNPKLPTVSLSTLRSLEIDHRYLSPRQWASLLHHLMGPDLEAIYIRGQPTIQAVSKFLAQCSHLRTLHFKARWATRGQPFRSSGFPHKTIQMPLLSEIEGPPYHIQAILKCLLCVPDTLTIKMDSDLGMTYSQYVHAALASMSLCGSRMHLEISIPPRYVQDHNVELDQGDMKSLATIALPEVAALELLFPPISERVLLACTHLFVKCITN